VSPSWVLYELMTSVLRSLLNKIGPSTHGPEPSARNAPHRAAVVRYF
jgi:hypothetical protein